MSVAKILWVEEEYDGPINGLAEYENQQLWFSKITSTTEERLYVLYRLDDNLLKVVTENHVLQCKNTGKPLNHGDPFKIKKKSSMRKFHVDQIKQLVPDGKDSIELEHRSLSDIKSYTHNIIPSEIKGDIVTILTEKEISNFFVPRICEYID
jgi:hypothetical protein